MACRIDDQGSAQFQRNVSQLRKSFRRIDEDLAGLYERLINGDFRQLGDAIPTFDSTVWKFRCESRDLNRGKSGGFRIIAFYNRDLNTLTPICIYEKKSFRGGQPAFGDLKKWIAALPSQALGADAS